MHVYIPALWCRINTMHFKDDMTERNVGISRTRYRVRYFLSRVILFVLYQFCFISFRITNSNILRYVSFKFYNTSNKSFSIFVRFNIITLKLRLNFEALVSNSRNLVALFRGILSSRLGSIYLVTV